MWLSLGLRADAVLMLNFQAGDYISSGFRGEQALWNWGVRVKGCAESQKCGGEGAVVAALRVWGSSGLALAQSSPAHCCEC